MLNVCLSLGTSMGFRKENVPSRGENCTALSETESSECPKQMIEADTLRKLESRRKHSQATCRCVLASCLEFSVDGTNTHLGRHAPTQVSVCLRGLNTTW